MDKFLNWKDFDVEHKNPSEEALRRWRSAVSIVKNRRRRFRMVADLVKRSEAEKKKLKIQAECTRWDKVDGGHHPRVRTMRPLSMQLVPSLVSQLQNYIKEKIRVALYVQKAALQFIDAAGRPEYKLSEETREAGFLIDPDDLAAIVRGRDIKGLKSNDGVEGVAQKLSVSLNEGVCKRDLPIRQKIYGVNRYTEKPPRSFLMFVWDALQDLTLIILIVCAVLSIGVGLATEGWPEGMYDGLGIILSILLVVMVTAISDYKQSLQFRDLDREKKKIFIQVTRDGQRQKVSIYDWILWLRVSDESSLSGQSEPRYMYEENPFLLAGTKVQGGSGKMLVTTVGMRTEWGKLMETLNEGGEDETPLQVKLNGLATIIGIISASGVGQWFVQAAFGNRKSGDPCEPQTIWASSCQNTGVRKVVKDKDGQEWSILRETRGTGVPSNDWRRLWLAVGGWYVEAQRGDGELVCKASEIVVVEVCGDESGFLTTENLGEPGYGEAVEGPEFRNMSPADMKRIIPKLQVMARSLPLDKHSLVTQLRKTFGEVVAVTGDGTNDAPALHEADIGLSMGIAGTEVAKGNADVIILDDNFSTIVNVAKWGRAVYINIQKFVQFQLTVNVVALVINFVSACASGSAPLTAVQLLWVNMIMDTLGALALATEPPHEGLMKRPPVAKGESFITKVMWRNIIGQSIYQLIILVALNFDGKQILGLSGADATAVLNTVIFNSFVFCQVFNEINSREIEKINVFKGMFDSWMFVGILVLTVAFQIIIIEFLGAFASTVPLSWQLWLLCILIGAVSMPIAVVIKCIPVKKSEPKLQHHDGYEEIPSGPESA
ncbi:hypothetical protein CUMW_226900 [Citrus unshiu]|uniref:P-type Ca(2+) transporter n=1 Tax=Citrus unshiu TaxID=55188 RepID=A0A2H5QG36_CITUN|nr:hypothetical protein CUMW_226900 [Citrus unshiu]